MVSRVTQPVETDQSSRYTVKCDHCDETMRSWTHTCWKGSKYPGSSTEPCTISRWIPAAMHTVKCDRCHDKIMSDLYNPQSHINMNQSIPYCYRDSQCPISWWIAIDTSDLCDKNDRWNENLKQKCANMWKIWRSILTHLNFINIPDSPQYPGE